MLPSSRTTVPESKMIVSGDSLPVSSAKKCEKSRKLCAGKQVKKGEDLTIMAMMATNAGGSLCHRRQIAQCSRCLSHLRGSLFCIFSLSHFLDGALQSTTEGLYCDTLKI